jgi:hypothetical protein
MKWTALQCPLDCCTPVFIHMLPDTHTHTPHISATPHKASINNSSGQQLCVHSFSIHLVSSICPANQHTHTHSQMHRGQHVQCRGFCFTMGSPTCPLRDCRPDLIPRQWTSWPERDSRSKSGSDQPFPSCGVAFLDGYYTATADAQGGAPWDPLRYIWNVHWSKFSNTGSSPFSAGSVCSQPRARFSSYFKAFQRKTCSCVSVHSHS